MRLLPKSDIQRLKQEEKRREIEEGLKISARVDELRQLVANEQANFERFRTETIAKINEEIGLHNTELEKLVSEVCVLREEKKNLLKPVTEEIAKAQQARIEAEQALDKAKEKLRDAEEAKQSAQVEKENCEKLTASARGMEQSAREVLLSASSKEKEAEQTLQNARIMLEKATQTQKETEENSHAVQMELEKQKAWVIIKERDLARQLYDLQKREKKLKSDQQLLKRNFIRYNKLKNGN